LKFTKEGGVSVRVSVVSNKQQRTTDNGQLTIHFELEDTGSGIAADELETLFEAFVQTKTGKEAQEGTGLGLPISHQFVKLMGGDMTVSSQVGRGSVFKFDIILSAADATDIETQQLTRRIIALEPNQPRYRILIVDDKWTNRRLLMKLLNPLGFELKEASNGQEAIAIWEHWEPHLIWMDMRMPILDGYETTKRIKATTKGQATAIIALTASIFEEERAIVLSAGCDDFVRKPFREADIFDTMHKHLGVRYVCDKPIDLQPRETTDSNALTPSAFATLPSDLRTNLQQAAICIDMDKIDRVLTQIRTHNAALAEGLALLAADFKYDQIADLIQQPSFPD
ncbi:MAG: response regulator, partial [Coleofasciculus sp. S288]|nr:response regulator [Coleofasciculus sp. S288]